jgi:primosomal protein N' (replication factor Y)
LRFPPHHRLIALLFADGDHDKAYRAARACATALRRRAAPLHEAGYAVFGPTPAPIARLRGRFRIHVVLRGPKPGPLRELLDAGLDEWRREADHDRVALTVDVDPVDLL